MRDDGQPSIDEYPIQTKATMDTRNTLGRLEPYPTYKQTGVEWLGRIPTHWEARPIKRVCTLSYGDALASIERVEGSIVVYGSNGPVGSHNLANTEAPCLVVGRKGSFGKVNYSAKPVFAIDTTFFVDSRCSSVELRWLYYVLQHASLDSVSRDSAVPGLDRENVYDREVAFCHNAEQRAIAAFLDRETAKIDALVAKKERLIELLQEKRSALITRAVTKGLDPDAPTKDSGVKWLGTIPCHWRISQLNRAVAKFVDYRGKTPEKVPFGVPLVTAKNIRNQMIDFSESQEYIREESYPVWMVRGLPERSDVVVTTEAPLGESAQITEPNVALAQRIVLLKARRNRVTNEYLKYHFVGDGGRYELQTRATGSTAVGIKASHLKASLIATPPIAEQNQITEFLDRETTEVDAMVAKVRAAIDHLKELRIALISAVVTGKIDVRDYATANPRTAS